MLETVKNSARLLSESDIDQIEVSVGFPIPKAYRRFLLKFNGGKPVPNAFPIAGLSNNPIGLLQCFLGVDRPINSSNILPTLEDMRGRMPEDLLPIACDHSGNLICLSLFGSNAGEVVFWEFYDEHAPPTRRNVYSISKDFSDFLQSIFELPESTT